MMINVIIHDKVIYINIASVTFMNGSDIRFTITIYYST